MLNPNVQLFSNRNLYLSSLPRRETGIGPAADLYKLPYYVKESELRRLAEALVKAHKVRGGGIRYIAAPSMSGKSACILPGFLFAAERLGHMKRLTHYVYMPFKNNCGNFHRNVPTTLVDRLAISEEMAGQCFVVACLEKQLLECSYVQTKDVEQCLSYGNALERLEALVDKLLIHHTDGCVLVHLDEHRYMCEDVAFRRGAFELLTQFPNKLTVIATFTDIPPVQPKSKSSTMCRIPIPKPIIDVAKLMREDVRFHIQLGNHPLKEPQEHLLISLRVLLGLVLEYLGLADLHGTPSYDAARFIDGLRLAKTDRTVSRSLVNCVNFCQKFWKEALSRSRGSTAGLVQLFVGIPEDSDMLQERRFGPIIVLEGYVSASLQHLLNNEESGTIDDVNSYNLFDDCRNAFLLELADDPTTCSGRLLERAFLWSLAVQSAVRARLVFHSWRFIFKCEGISSGSIVNSTFDVDSSLAAKLQPGILYYAGDKSHPRADMWFKTSFIGKESVVLMDIGGTTNLSKINAKFDRMLEVVNGSDLLVFGVVLAPNLDIEMTDRKALASERVAVVFGTACRALLGGLAQLLPWLVDDAPDE